jgi:AcrR family transcriptional regulator
LLRRCGGEQPATPGAVSVRRLASPLAAVIAALEHAAELGELSPGDLEWCLKRLTGRFRGELDADGTGRRNDILRVASRVFLRRGYHHVTISEIAGELSLTKAGVYHYFGSKQEILEAICDQAMAACEGAVIGSLATPGTAAERLQHVAERYAELFLSDERLVVLVRHYYYDVSEIARAGMRKRRKALEAQLRQALEDGVREGVFEAPDASVAMLGMLGTVNWMYSWYQPDGRLAAAEVRDVVVRQVLRGVMP